MFQHGNINKCSNKNDGGEKSKNLASKMWKDENSFHK